MDGRLKDPHRLSALEAGHEIAAGRLTSEALVRACLDRIAAHEASVGAWTYLDPPKAIEEARRRDREPARGPLHGVPVGVKDVIDTHDMPTEYGSAIYPGHRPAWDAACVALLRNAGMVVMGKTVTTEFATRSPGKTANPRNPEHTPGGSSSGSAAAVADFHVPLAIGTQTAGSVIRPASYCGAVGYKPTYGFVPRAGVKLLAESLDTVGTIARTVADAGAFARAMAGLAASAAPPLGGPPRIGLCRTPAWSEAEKATEYAMQEAVVRVSRAGASVVDVELPPPFELAGEAHAILMPYEQAHLLADERLRHADRLSHLIRGSMDQGLAATRERYEWSRQVQALCRASIGSLFARVDVLLTPSAPGEAPKGLTATGSPVFNRIWTLVGVPCVTVPGLDGAGGLPVGVQVVGPMDGDARTLAAAEWVHRALAA